MKTTTRREFLKQSALAGAALSVTGCWPRLARKRSAGQESVAAVDPAVIRKFAKGLQGRVILPADGEYESARRVFNRAVDRHPGMIVRCAGTRDVIRAVDFARRHDLVTAVRAGGHSLGGKSVCDAGMVIDLSGMKRIEVDPARQSVRAETGVLLGEFDRATQAFNLATTLGTVPTTGVAGLTLGGGLGWLMGKYGLACDNVRRVELVTADGRTIAASAEENADLYWAVRGAGANFGVVTAIEYQLHPVGPVLAGAVIHPPSGLKAALRLFREFPSTFPDEMTAEMGTFPLAAGPAHSLQACYCGDPNEGERFMRPLRGFRPQSEDAIRPRSYVDMQELFGVPPRTGPGIYARSSFLKELSDDAIEVIVAYDAKAPSPACAFFLEEFHGAVCRVSPSETAFHHREQGYNLGIFAMWEDPAAERATTEWGRGFWKAMRPFAKDAVYSNYLQDEGDDRARAAYGGNYSRLARLKSKYDPSNFFRANQNIHPTA
jgi:FAD/FMN-containing dehydrogenase